MADEYETVWNRIFRVIGHVVLVVGCLGHSGKSSSFDVSVSTWPHVCPCHEWSPCNPPVSGALASTCSVCLEFCEWGSR